MARPRGCSAAGVVAACLLAATESPVVSAGTAGRPAERFGVVEASFEHAGQYSNPYTAVTASVRLTGPDGRQRPAALFWDGGRLWKLRFSPDRAGTWAWQVASNDAGLDGRTGSVAVVESSRRGGIQRMKGHPYHFEYQDGTPFWFMGETAWGLFTDNAAERHDWAAARHYIDTRAAQGFNVVHAMLISEAGWGNRGGKPFSDMSAERLNPGYWQEVDRRIEYLNRRGITAGLVLAWGDKGRNDPLVWRRLPSLPARLRYARYVAARYSAYNVYFIVAGEWNADGRRTPGQSRAAVKAGYVAIGDEIRRNDPQRRMVAIHPMTRDGSSREFVGTNWMSFGDYQQNYRHLHARILLSRRFDRPVVNAEYAYYLRDRDGDGQVDKPNSRDLASIRHATWDIVMAGGYFVTGFGSTYFAGNRHPGPFDVDAACNDDWERQVQYVKKLFERLEWWRLEPHDELITGPVPRGPDRGRGGATAPPATTYWLLADPGRVYVAYVRGCRQPVRVALGSGGSGQYRLRQFNPRSGRFAELGQGQAGPDLSYAPPDQNDWVLLITVQEAGRP